MEEWPCGILSYVEIDYFSRELSKSSFLEIGTLAWLEKQKRCHFLYLEAAYQASKMEEPEMKNLLFVNNKVHVLIHEALMISCWRAQVLPEILAKLPTTLPEKDSMTSNFELLLYGILYHEVTTTGILAHLLYDEEICEMAGEDGPDLVDYCCRLIAQFLGRNTAVGGQHGELKALEIEQFVNAIFLRTVANAIPILRFLACHSDRLSSTFSTRMLVTHDVPMLIAQLLESNRLQELNSKEHMLFSTTEHHIFILLTVLLFSPEAAYKYEITEERKAAFLKIRKLLTPEKVKSNASVGVFRHWLDELSLNNGQKYVKKPSLVEEVASASEQLMKEAERRKVELSQHFFTLLAKVDEKQLYEKFASTYEVDKLLQAYDSVLHGSSEHIAFDRVAIAKKKATFVPEDIDNSASGEFEIGPPPSRAAAITPFGPAREGKQGEAARVDETIKAAGSKLSFRMKKNEPIIESVKTGGKMAKFSFLKKVTKQNDDPYAMD